MTPQQLKNSILQLAIQGKLVEQRPEEGTGQELFNQIQEEKQKLIAEGKIKKEKALAPITDVEIPFDIPDSWLWCRVNSISEIDPRNKLSDDTQISFIPMKLVDDGFRNQYTSEIKYWKDVKKGFNHIAEDDIGVAKITPCFQNRKSVIFKKLPFKFGATTTELKIVRRFGSLQSSDYLFWFFKTNYFIANGVKSFSGTAGQQRINKDYLESCLLPLPPLEEQKRIVAKIEELLPYVDKYQEYYDELELLNSKFPGQLRKSILQYAIEGKLVEQRPKEGTGQDLFNQIQEEKQKLIAEGKIKKEKAIPPISEEEIPFDIPNNWSWVRIGELGVYKKGPFGSALTKSLFVAKGTDTIKVYEQKNAIRKDASLGEYYITKEYFENKMTSFEVFPRDVIVSCAGTIGEIYQLPDKIEKGIINQALMRIRLMPSMRYDFYSLIFDFLIKDYSQKDGNGSAIKNIPPFADFKNYLVPLPPLEEQKCIVAKVEELFKLCDKLDLS